MRREVKLGIFITLSAGLVIAVVTGKAITGKTPTPEERLALLANEDSGPDITRLPVPLESVIPAPRPAGESEEPAEDDTEAAVNELINSIPSGRIPEAPTRAESSGTAAGGDSTADMGQKRSEIADIVAGKKDDTRNAGRATQSPVRVDTLETLADITLKEQKLRPPEFPARSEAGRLPEDHVKAMDEIDAMLGDIEPGDAQPAGQSVEAPARSTAIAAVEEAMTSSTGDSTGKYVVKAGDTFWDIAIEVYGKGIHANKIAAANPNVKAHKLSVGTVLVIPGLEKPAEAQAHETTAVASSAKRTHIVQADDTLWDLAVKYYGSGIKYKKIEEANPDINADRLKPGSKLVIPE
ncbi:MAG: LysM peptidoglycan-binding domain-containing protein [Planctomycetes bacterium]|nr:LysM peptidoglycan-binding domain-containing protein [Planctomycetota bacterium]